MRIRSNVISLIRDQHLGTYFSSASSLAASTEREDLKRDIVDYLTTVVLNEIETIVNLENIHVDVLVRNNITENMVIGRR